MTESPSFFDIQGQNIWETCESILNQQDIIYEGILQYNKRPTQFILTQYYLYRYKNNRLHKKIELTTTSISLVNDTTISLIKNSKQFILASKSQSIQFWFEQLKNKCIQNNFRMYYDIGEIVGQGQFANVYKVTNKKTSQKYALKVFQKVALKNLNVDNISVIKEISIMRQLKHPGILKIFEVYEDKEFICLVMELMAYSMKSQKRKHSESYCALIMLQLFMALKYLHDNKIIHRDIKLDNILYKNQDTICISDFGLADYYNPQSKYQYQRCGTPGYVAPEVLRDQKYDYKVDVYSAGIILYTLLVGKQPFSAHSQNKVVQLNYSGRIDYSQIQASDLCQQFLKLILTINPAQRPSSYEVIHHEWFIKTLGDQHYFQLMNIQQYRQQPQMEQVKSFQAIQQTMDEEQDDEDEESSINRIQLNFTNQNNQQHQIQQQNQNNPYYSYVSNQSQPLKIAIDNIQEAIKDIKIKQQQRDLNYLMQTLELQHKEMQHE